MAIPKKNLLEAFQASAAAEKAKIQAPAEATGAKAGGPFAPQPASAPPPPVVRSAPKPESALRRPDALQRLIALQVVITIAAFFLGRASVGGVAASEPSVALEQPEQPARPAAKPVAAPTSTSAVGVVTSADAGNAAERALLDPNNRYTVKLAEYQKGRDDAVAAATLQWLVSQGLPAAAKYQGARLFLLVGAAPKQAELDGLRDRLKTMNGPPPLNKPAEFHDAYISSIDRLITR